MTDFDASDAIICEACGYPVHRAAVALTRVLAAVHADDPTVTPEALDQCYRCAYQQAVLRADAESRRAEVLAGLLRRRHALDPIEVAEALKHYS